MKPKNTPAFPIVQSVQENELLRNEQTSSFSGFEMGLTKREYFTAKAMQGLLSNPNWMKEYQKDKYLMQKRVVAEVAIEYADEVLKKLSIEEVKEQ